MTSNLSSHFKGLILAMPEQSETAVIHGMSILFMGSQTNFIIILGKQFIAIKDNLNG